MSIYLQIIAVAIAFILIVEILSSLKDGKVSDKQALLWLLAGVVIIILSIFPGILPFLADCFNISWPPAILLFAVLVLFGFIIFSHTRLISNQRSQIAELAMQVALLKDQLKEYEQHPGKKEDTISRDNTQKKED